MHSLKTERSHSSIWEMEWAQCWQVCGMEGRAHPWREEALHYLSTSALLVLTLHFKKVSRHHKSLKFIFIFDVSIVCFSPLDKAELFFILGGHWQLLLMNSSCKTLQRNFNSTKSQFWYLSKISESICRHNIRLKPCNCTCLCTCVRDRKDKNITCFSIRNLVLKFFLKICWCD